MTQVEDTLRSDITLVVCEECMDIAYSAELKQNLLAALEKNKPVHLDASSVDRVDTAVLQVLAAFFKDAHAQGMDVIWKHPTNVLYDAAKLIGLEQVLNLRH